MNQKIGTILIIAITVSSAIIIYSIPTWVEKAEDDAAGPPYETVILTDVVIDTEPCDFSSVDLTSMIDNGTTITLIFQSVPLNDTNIHVGFYEMRGTRASAMFYSFEFDPIGNKTGEFNRMHWMGDTAVLECWNGTHWNEVYYKHCFVPINGTIDVSTRAFIIDYSSFVTAGALGRMVDVGHDSYLIYASVNPVGACGGKRIYDAMTDASLGSNPVFIIIPIIILGIGGVSIIVFNVKKYQQTYQTRL